MCSFVKPPEGETTLSEMYCFFAIKSLTSRVKELHYSEYWTKVKFLRTDIVGRIMNRDRYPFFDLLVEAREFCSKFRFSFENYFSPFSNLCINKGLSLHKARLSFKQYIPSKRNNRFGIKSFIPCDCKSGYVLRFLVYTGNKNKWEASGKIRRNRNSIIRMIFRIKKMPHFVDIWYTNLALPTSTYLQKNPMW